MKCRHLFSFVLVAFLSLFFGSFITTSNTFALDDLVVTQSTSDICGGDCYELGYRYVIVTDPDFWINQSNFRRLSFGLSCGASVCFQDFNSYSSLTIFEIVPNYVIKSVTFRTVSGHQPLTVTLSDHLPGSSAPPSGDIFITSNGTYDVSSYASATVAVPPEVIQGDYHDDLVNIQNSIITCGAILLVLYFFYCIYRLIIKNSGVH